MPWVPASTCVQAWLPREGAARRGICGGWHLILLLRSGRVGRLGLAEGCPLYVFCVLKFRE